MSEPNYAEDMKLPAGKTCSDCYAARFCVGIGCTTPERTTCDYWPNRFRERVRAATPAEVQSEPREATAAEDVQESVAEAPPVTGGKL